MSFFILTSALVCAVLIFLTWYVIKLKNQNKILEFDRDEHHAALMSLESHVAESPDKPERWPYILANAVSNQNGKGRIEWGKAFNDHLQRTVVRDALLGPDAADQLVGHTNPVEDSDSLIERAVEREDRKKSKKK